MEQCRSVLRVAEAEFDVGGNEAGWVPEVVADAVMDHNADGVAFGDEEICNVSKLQLPLRCGQFRLKELRIRTPSPMLGQAMFICVPSALLQWN